MKSYDQTVEAVFDRIHAYNARKRRRTTLNRRIAISCCAASLLGVGVWQLNHRSDDIPISVIIDKDDKSQNKSTTNTTPHTNATTAATTNATESLSTSTSSTTFQTAATRFTGTTTDDGKPLIIADEPDTGITSVIDESSLFYTQPISSLLMEQMELHKDADVEYAVLVAIYPSNYRIPSKDPNSQGYDPDYHKAYDAFISSDEMVRLAEEEQSAREAYIAADEALSTCPDDVYDEYYEDYVAKRQIYRELSSEYDQREYDFYREYYTAIADQKLATLAELSSTELYNLNTVYPSAPYRQAGIPRHHMAILSISYRVNYGYAAVLSADEIDALAEQGGYAFWLDSLDSESDVDYGFIMDMG